MPQIPEKKLRQYNAARKLLIDKLDAHDVSYEKCLKVMISSNKICSEVDESWFYEAEFYQNHVGSLIESQIKSNLDKALPSQDVYLTFDQASLRHIYTISKNLRVMHDGHKTGPRRLKTAPTRLQDFPKKRPQRHHDAPTTAPASPHTASPRRPTDGPRAARDSSKTTPQTAQDSPNAA